MVFRRYIYNLWERRDYSGETVVVLGGDYTGEERHFRSVVTAARVDNLYARATEHFDIYLCRGPMTDLRTLWPSIRKW
jgi:hypothetical protein